MSLPEFPQPNPCLTREKALNMILTSIAMEETALSRVIEAESDKLRHILACDDCCDDVAVLAVNKSIHSVLEMVMQTQIILKGKMEKVLEASPPCPCGGQPCGCCQKRNQCEELCAIRIEKSGAVAFEIVEHAVEGIALDANDPTAIRLPYDEHWAVRFMGKIGSEEDLGDIRLETRLYRNQKVVSTATFHLEETETHAGSFYCPALLHAREKGAEYLMRIFVRPKAPLLRLNARLRISAL